MDGASRWQSFWNITLPGLRSVSTMVILLGIIWTFNLFAVIFFTTRGGPAGKTNILVTFAYDVFNQGELAMAATYRRHHLQHPHRLLAHLPATDAGTGMRELV